MNKELNRYLDGELEPNELSAELKGEAEAWDAFLTDVRESGASEAPVGLESMVMDSVRAERKAPWSRLIDWWVNPQSLRIRPLIGLAAAAAIATFFLLPNDAVLPAEPAGAATALVGEEAVYVQFVLEAPEAQSVAVAGDFNDWSPDIGLADPDGDGIWAGRVRLAPGVHKYMFLVDGQQWVTDPLAERYTEDGFGNRNAVIAITGGAGAGSLAP
ncbi:MAG: isoamylase early set domain-containing protein [Gemmatimonadetes bacterium]|nr:isoamylase early set domain-containing protein [Gemmatimonadota bacterium]